MAKKTKVQQFLEYLQAFGPMSVRQADEAGFNALRNAKTRQRLMGSGAIEKFLGTNPHSYEHRANSACHLFRIGENQYAGNSPRVEFKESTLLRYAEYLRRAGFQVIDKRVKGRM